MKDVLTILYILIGTILLVYFLSRLQMKAWFHEIDNQLGKKFLDTLNKLKREKDEERKQ